MAGVEVPGDIRGPAQTIENAERMAEEQPRHDTKPIPEGFKRIPSDPDQELLPDGFKPAAAGSVAHRPAGLVPLSEENRKGMIVPQEQEEPGIVKQLGTKLWDHITGEQLGGTAIGGFVGGRAGAAATGVIPHPVAKGGGIIIGAATGSILGATSPEAAMEAAEFVGLVGEGYREEHGFTDAEMLTYLEGEIMLEAMMPGVFGLLRKGKRVGVGLFTGLSKESRALATRLGMENNIWSTPVQIGKSRVAKGFVFIFGRMPAAGGGKVGKWVRANEEQYRAALEALPARFAPTATWSEISTEIAQKGQALVQQFRSEISAQYEKIWKMADDLGVAVEPRRLTEVANEIREELTKKRQRGFEQVETDIGTGVPLTEVKEVKGPFPDAGKAVIDFIEEEIDLMINPETGELAGQTFKHMDGIAEKIQNKLAKLDPADAREARKWFTDLMHALQWDALNNASGPQAKAIREQILATDKKFSQFWQQIADTATAQKFAGVQKKGLRGITKEEATRLPVDQLTNIIRINDSPQVARELHALVGQDTYNRVISTYLTDAYERAFVGVGSEIKKFDPRAFSEALGITKSTSSRRAAVKEMLELGNTGMTLDTLDELVDVGVMLQDIDVPKMSVFLARSATIGGLKNLINRLIPIAVVQSGVGKGTWLGANMMVAGVGIIGSQLIMRSISNPMNAVLVRKMFDKEAPFLVRRNAFSKVFKTAIQDMTLEEASREAGLTKTRTSSGKMTEEQFVSYKDKALKLMDMFFDKVKEEADYGGQGEIE